MINTPDGPANSDYDPFALELARKRLNYIEANPGQFLLITRLPNGRVTYISTGDTRLLLREAMKLKDRISK